MRKLFNSKLKLTLASIFVAVGAFFAINNVISPVEAQDCTSNAVIRCGITSVQDLRNAYDQDRTKGMKNIFSHFGITRSVVFNNTVKNGTVHKNGNVYVGDKLVATNGYSAGREYMPGSTKHTVNGTTFYTRPMSVSYPSKWDAYVFLDKNGKFVAAVLKVCGNPVGAKPVEPPKPKPVYECVSVSRIKQSDTKYIFRGKSAAQNGAKPTSFTFEFGDGKSQKVNVQRTEGKYAYADAPYTYAKSGTYTVKVTAHFTVNGKTVSHTSADCKKSVTIKVPTPPAPKNPGVSIDKTVRTSGDDRDDDKMTKEEALEQARNFRPKGHCTTVMTPAVHVETGATYTFPSGCLPEGWVRADRQSGTARSTATSTQATTTNVTSASNWSEHVTVTPGVDFQYRLVIKNTGDVALKDVKVSDPAPAGVTFKSADKGTVANNVWSYTIPELKVGQSVTVVITASVAEATGKVIKNTACVDASEVPGDKDDCDDATVDTKKPEPTPEPVYIDVCRLEDKEYPVRIKEEDFNPELHSKNPEDCKETPAPVPEEDVVVCNPETGEIITVKESEADKYVDKDSDECKEKEEPVPVKSVVKELPQTGLAERLSGIFGLGALTTALYYYVASRRN